MYTCRLAAEVEGFVPVRNRCLDCIARNRSPLSVGACLLNMDSIGIFDLKLVFGCTLIAVVRKIAARAKYGISKYHQRMNKPNNTLTNRSDHQNSC